MFPTLFARCLLTAVAGILIHAGSAIAQPAKPLDPAPQPKPQEVATLHILLVMDTSDPNIATGVKIDLRNLKQLFATHIPKNRYELTTIDGPSITPEKVLDYYKNLKIKPGDGLLFYYSGHGSMRDGKGHTLELQVGTQPLYRSELIKAMKAKQAAATIVLTDCCSDRRETPTDFVLQTGKDRPGIPTEPSPIAKKLFFQPQSKGIVDITAATNDVALSDIQHGGYFTFALFQTMNKYRETAMGWKDFHQNVARATKDVIITLPPQARTGLKPQEPTLLSPLPESDSVRRVAAVVSFTNPTNTDIEFEVRWNSTAPWTKKKIAANGKISLGTWLPTPTSPLPELQVKLDGNETSYAANRFDKEGMLPRFSDGKQYRLGEVKGRSRSFVLDPKPETDKSEESVPVEEPSLPTPPVGSRPMYEK